MNRFSQLPFIFGTIAVVIVLVLPTLIQDGMFMDAVLYTSVAHNLSQGIGTFWFPQFGFHNVAGLDAFHEQPPLGFGIQACFFYLFGSSLYVERFYTLICLIITTFLIARIWHEAQPTSSFGSWWLPILSWISIPLVFWSFSNNMLENTMGIFILCSCFFSVKFMQSPQMNWSFAFAAALFIVLAALTKGVPGLFPLAVPIIYALVYKPNLRKRAVLITIVMLAILLISAYLLYLIPSSRQSLSTYINERLLHRIGNDPLVQNRFVILYRLITELIPAMLITVALWATLKRFNSSKANTRLAFTFFIIGLAGVLPLTLTLVQRGFYMVPALPFFAIGLAILVQPQMEQVMEKIQHNPRLYNWSLGTSITLLAISVILTLSNIGGQSRHKELLNDVYMIGAVIPDHTIVEVENDLSENWSLHTYLMRYFNISTDPYGKYEYYICSNRQKCVNREGYELLKLETNEFQVYRKK